MPRLSGTLHASPSEEHVNVEASLIPENSNLNKEQGIMISNLANSQEFLQLFLIDKTAPTKIKR
jgi:hypothetical protein